MSLPRLKLNTGFEMPLIGLGTWMSKPGEVESAVECALGVGYRHIDCAPVYRNEKEVGLGIEAAIGKGKVKREDLFIVSKLWNAHHDPKDVRSGLIQSLKDLGLEYLDLFLMHWPMAFLNNGHLFPFDENGKLQFSDVDYVDTWKAMEKLLEEGLVKSIGVSNFNEYQLTRVLEECKVVPANNQIELHPYLLQDDLVEFCHKQGISVTAYCPLGCGEVLRDCKEHPILLDDPNILRMAERLGKTPAQVLIRFQIQRGINVIPKSVNPSRIMSNFQVFDFKLSEEDIKLIRSLNINHRINYKQESLVNKYYPFQENYKE